MVQNSSLTGPSQRLSWQERPRITVHLLIAGGTGFVGSEIARQALAKGHTVRCLARGTRDLSRCGQELKKMGVEICQGNITDPASLSSAFGGVDVLVHAVGIIRETKNQTFERVVASGTRNLVNEAKRNRLQHITYISAAGTRANARSTYHQTKWQAEQLILQSGVPYTIFRPSVIFGPEDEFISLLAKLVRYNPVVPVIGSGFSKLQPVSVRDLALCAVESLTNPKAKNQIFEIGGSEALTYDELLNVVMRATGRRRLKFHLPLGLARPVVRLLEAVLPSPPVTSEQLVMLQEDNVCDNRRLIETFGITLLPLEAGIREYLH